MTEHDHPLTHRIRPGDEPPWLSEYERSGGYEAVRSTVGRTEPKAVQEMVVQSGLRGRGGAGFPTGKKWSFVPMGDDAPRPKYVIANADEMEPGTFKDRLLMEGDPHQLIEGLVLSGYAIGAEVGYIFLRQEYTLAARRLRRAIAEASDRGYLGADVVRSGWRFHLYLHTSAGRYICGEETALLNALEGKRPVPRAKPPYPQIAGLWGKPTIVQNVETLCNVPHIVRSGADWYRSLGRGTDGGTKVYGVSGRVNRPGAWELPMGTTLGEIVSGHAGGMRQGLQFRGLLPGGASTAFLTEAHLDVPMDFEGVAKAGSRLGTGTMIVLDDRTCPVAMLLNLQRFFAQESCGWCTPCRDGLPWVARLLQALEEGRGTAEDLQLLDRHTKWLGFGNTYCALAPGAMDPLASAMTYFKADFEAHVAKRRCPWRNGAGGGPCA